MPLLYILFLLPLPIWILFHCLLITTRHKKSIRQIKLFNTIAAAGCSSIFKDVKMKLTCWGRSREYINIISNCDIYLSQHYFVIVPFQTFPFKAYHPPVLFVHPGESIDPQLSFLHQSVPVKISFKQVIKDEIEIRYTRQNINHQITLKALEPHQKKAMKIIQNWC
jgi:hypothetical protein